MLPLHTIFRNTGFISFLLILFTSCSEKAEKNSSIIKTLDESLSASNRLLTASTSDILSSLNSKLNDRGTHERAKVWFSKAQKVASFSKEVNDYIEKLKVELSESAFEKGNAGIKLLFQNKDRIYDSLTNYERKVLNVDDRIHDHFSKLLVVVSSSFDKSGKNGSDLFKTYFDNANLHSSIAMLTKLQNNIRVIEYRLIMFCHEQVGTTGGPCMVDWPLIVISSSVVEPKGRLELVAGINSYNPYLNAEVFVYDKPVQLNENALAVCKFKAGAKPGKYFVPVKISYTDQDGRKQTVTKEIEYTVADIQKQ